jgi:hypothetical protein
VAFDASADDRETRGFISMTMIRPFFGVDRELDVRPAGLDADPANDPPAEIAHPLILPVGQGQRRRYRNAVAGVHAHRVDVLDRADDDEVVGLVAHHLELEFLPADDRLFEQDLVHRAHLDAAPGNLLEFLDVVGDAAANAAHRERRPNDDREADLVDCGHGLRHRSDVPALGDVGADFSHRVAEAQAIFGDLDRLDRRADELDTELLERAVLAERHGQVERGLPADGREDRVGAFVLDDLGNDFRRQRLDVGAIRELRVGHDRRRVAVDEHDLDAFAPQRFARLRAGVVELACLADDDRARTDDENAFDVSAFWHLAGARLRCERRHHARSSITSRNWRNR